jgi:hypothetical protein
MRDVQILWDEMCQLSISETKDLKVERFFMAHDFGGYSPWLFDPIAFEPMEKQNIMTGNT